MFLSVSELILVLFIFTFGNIVTARLWRKLFYFFFIIGFLSFALLFCCRFFFSLNHNCWNDFFCYVKLFPFILDSGKKLSALSGRRTKTNSEPNSWAAEQRLRCFNLLSENYFSFCLCMVVVGVKIVRKLFVSDYSTIWMCGVDSFVEWRRLEKGRAKYAKEIKSN